MSIANRKVLFSTMVLFVGMELCFRIGGPDRLASNAGYKGAIQMFALDPNVPLIHYQAPYQMIDSYGDIGRKQVVVSHLLFDFVFPVIYVLLFVSAFGLLGRALVSSASRWSHVGVAVATTAGVADWAENVGILAMASSVQNRRGWVIQETTVSTDLHGYPLGLL